MLSVDPTQVMSKTFERLTQLELDAYVRATALTPRTGIPPAFATRYRDTEFMWLEKSEVDMRQLLHTDQEYEYAEPLKVGDIPHAETRVTDVRQKRHLSFYTLVTTITSQGVLKVKATTTFVVRQVGV